MATVMRPQARHQPSAPGRKIAMGYRGYGLPISEVISEGNVGLMQAVKRFEPEKGFRSRPTQCGGSRRDPGIHPALVVVGEDGHHRQPEEAVLQPAQAKSKISALEEGDLRPDQVKLTLSASASPSRTWST